MSKKQYSGGLFSPPVFNATADPYNSKRESPLHAHGMTPGAKQFGIGLGIPSKFVRLFEGEKFKSAAKIESEQRLEGKAKFLTPNGFKQSSGFKLDACPGDFSGTFSKKAPPYMPQSNETRGPRSKYSDFKQRPIYTAPPKKAVGAPFTTPNIHFTPLIYESSPYDSAVQAEKVPIEEAGAVSFLLTCNW